MTSIDQLLSWDPAALGAAAESLNADRKTLVDLQDEMDGGQPPATWRGQAATAAGESHTALYDRLADLVAAVSPVVGALDAAQADIQAAKSDLIDAKSTIAAEGWVLRESGGSVTVSAPPSSGSGGGVLGAIDQAADRARMAALAQRIADALQQAEQADADLAAVLQGARTGRYDAGAGTLANAALPPELRGLSDQQLVDYLLHHPDRDFDVDALSTAQQQLLGETIADRYDSYADGKAPERWWSGEAEPPTLEEIRGLNTLLESYGDDSTVATAMLNELGPEGLLHVQQTMLCTISPFDHSQDYADAVGDSQTLWGQTLAAGTSDWHSGESGSSEHVSQQWVDGLIEAAGKGGRSVDGYGVDETYALNNQGMPPSGYQLLAPLLRNPGHSADLLTSVGDAIESYEKAYEKENGSLPWFGAVNQLTPLDLTSGAPEDWGDPSSYDHETGYDPMGGLMEGLSHNPEAARDFLSGGDGDRVDYYMNDREWMHHEEWAYDDLDIPSGMSHFGDALVTATTVDPTATSADLAEQAVHSAAGAGDGLAQELKQPMGTILGGYMPDVYSSLSGDVPVTDGDADPWLPGSQDAALQASFDEHELRGVLGVLGGDDAASNTISGAATQYAQYGYDHYFGGASDGAGTEGQTEFDTWESRLANAQSEVNSPYAEVISALGHGRGEQMVADGLAADAAASAQGDSAYQVGGWIAEQVVDKGVGAIPFVGDIGAGAINEAVTGPLTDHLVGMNDVDTTNEVRQEVGQMIADTHGTAGAMAQEAVYSHLPLHALPEELVHDGERVPMSQWSSEQQDAWTRFQTETGYGGLYGQLADDLEDELVGSHSQAEQEGGG